MDEVGWTDLVGVVGAAMRAPTKLPPWHPQTQKAVAVPCDLDDQVIHCGAIGVTSAED